MTRPSAASRVPTRCPVTVGPPGASALSFRVTRLPTCRLISCGVIASLLLSAFQPSAGEILEEIERPGRLPFKATGHRVEDLVIFLLRDAAAHRSPPLPRAAPDAHPYPGRRD